MSSPDKNAGKPAKQKNKSKGVRGLPRYTTNLTGSIQTQQQINAAKDALSAVMSQLKEKSGEKFLAANSPGTTGWGDSSHSNGMGDNSDGSQNLNDEVCCSLMGSGKRDLRDSIQKRRSQMGLPDTDNTSDGSVGQLWDSIDDIASGAYAEFAGIDQGASSPKIVSNNGQWSIVHKHVDALEDELCNNNHELVRRIDACNNFKSGNE